VVTLLRISFAIVHLKYLISMPVRGWCVFFVAALIVSGQGHQGAPPQTLKDSNPDAPAAARGKAAFQSNCGFCHGEDGTGSRAPDLIRSSILNHDENGNLISVVIKNGRPDKGMPAFSTLKDEQIADIVAFLHRRAYEAAHSARVPRDYPLEKLLTGNATAGKAYFEGAGGCTGCHSVSKDLAQIANKYQPLELQQRIVYPASKSAVPTASVTTRDGKVYEGKVKSVDEFDIGIFCQDGWFRSWPRSEVKVDVKDPLAAHRELTTKYTDADMHNLFAYLETLK
jgi:cytochrome c oxidase cbb3-type subunit 3